MKVLFAETKFWDKHQDFQQRYEAKILRAATAAKKLLKDAPGDITFLVQTNSIDSIPEYGSGAYTSNSRLVLLTIDPGLPYGTDIQLRYAREAVFHEMNHCARFEKGYYHSQILDKFIMEGLATAFERDHAGAEPLYGQYDAAECREWLAEVQDDYREEDYYQYMFRHEDGRKWIGYKVGTYIVDEAKKKSRKSIAALTALPCDDIKELSGLDFNES